MIRRLFLICSTLLVATQLAHAEAQRALLTHENRFPEVGKAEVGALYNYSEYDNSNGDEQYLAPYGRYTIIQNLTLNATVPYRWIEPEFDSSESGIGDVSVGLELLAYQDIFEYPWVIPHVDVAAETGDEDKGLGSGETVSTFGLSVGTTVYDVLHYVADISYALNGGHEQPNPDNVVIFSGSIIWDVSDKFAVLVEGRITDEDTIDDETPQFIQGGMSYKFTDDFQLSWYGGSSRAGGDRDADVVATVKAAYSF